VLFSPGFIVEARAGRRAEAYLNSRLSTATKRNEADAAFHALQ
jgi:hypothetical protein